MSGKFKVGDTVYSPNVGIGIIQSEKDITAAGHSFKALVLSFETGLTIHSQTGPQTVPKRKAEEQWWQVASKESLLLAFQVLAENKKAKTKPGTWSRNIAEYRGTLNNGDLSSIAQVYVQLKNSGDPQKGPSADSLFVMDQALRNISINLAFTLKIESAKAESILLDIIEKKLSPKKAAEEYLKIDASHLVYLSVETEEPKAEPETSPAIEETTSSEPTATFTPEAGSSNKKIEVPVVLPEEFKSASAYEAVMAIPLGIAFREATSSHSNQSPANDPATQIARMIRKNPSLKTLQDLWKEIDHTDWPTIATERYKIGKKVANNVKDVVARKILTFSSQLT